MFVVYLSKMAATMVGPSKNHVQTARESHDFMIHGFSCLKTAFSGIDNSFEKLCA